MLFGLLTNTVFTRMQQILSILLDNTDMLHVMCMLGCMWELMQHAPAGAHT